MNVLEKTSNLTKGTTVYNTNLAKKATEGLGKKVTEAKLPDNLKVGKPGTQLKLSFPKVGVLDLVGAFAPFLKQAMDAEKRKGQL